MSDDVAIQTALRSLAADHSQEAIDRALNALIRSGESLPEAIDRVIAALRAARTTVPEWLLDLKKIIWDYGIQLAKPRKLADVINALHRLLDGIRSPTLKPLVLAELRRLYPKSSQAFRSSFVSRLADGTRRLLSGAARGVTTGARWLGKHLWRAWTGVARYALSGLRLAAAGIARILPFLGPVGTTLLVLGLLVAVGIGLYLLLRNKVPTGPYCDCTHVEAGLLTREYQNQCRGAEAALVALAAEAKLNLVAGPDGKLVSGAFCDPVTAGPNAWPVKGGPAKPPPRGPDEKPCEEVSGLSRTCR